MCAQLACINMCVTHCHHCGLQAQATGLSVFNDHTEWLTLDPLEHQGDGPKSLEGLASDDRECRRVQHSPMVDSLRVL
jgi:hypothetical protein